MHENFFLVKILVVICSYLATTFDKNNENIFYQIFFMKLAFLYYLKFVKTQAEQLKKFFFKSMDWFQSCGYLK